MSRSKALLQSLLVIAFGFALGASLVETALRVAGVSYPGFYTIDEELGARLRPGASGRWTDEGESDVLVNARGWRDREHAQAKPPGTFRIAVLGDSYVEALHVAREAAFWSVLEKELAVCPRFSGREVEVIAFGVSGYGTAQELIAMQREVWAYSPDLVVLAFVSGNDVRNNSRVLEKDPLRPYFTLKDGALALDDSFRRSPEFQSKASVPSRLFRTALAHSRLVQLSYRMSKGMLAPRDRAPAALEVNPYAEPGIDPHSFNPTDPEWTEAWRVTEALISEIHREVAVHHAGFLLVGVTNGIQVRPDAKARADFMRAYGIEDLDYADHRLKILAERDHFDALFLADTMRGRAEKEGRCLHGFGNPPSCVGHWNAEGHRLAGETVAERICAGVPSN